MSLGLKTLFTVSEKNILSDQTQNCIVVFFLQKCVQIIPISNIYYLVV